MVAEIYQTQLSSEFCSCCALPSNSLIIGLSPSMPTDVANTKELKRLTNEALSYSGPRGILAAIVDELVGILESVSGFRVGQEQSLTDGETVCDHGLAISPAQAACCAGEYQRTAFFLRGAHSAIMQALEAKPGRVVRVLYAGSGPYATLAVPLMTIFPPEKVKFTILDLHNESIQSVRSIVSQLGLQSSVESYVVTDACSYTIPPRSLPDILLCETMSTALEKEPQVGITRHLLGQAPDAIMVPEFVQIEAFLVDTSDEPEIIIPESEEPSESQRPNRISLGPVFELSKAAIRSWPPTETDSLPAQSIRLPLIPKPSYRPFLFTTIITHGEHVLLTHDCNLTGIREIMEIDALAAGGDSYQFTYLLGQNPRLVAEASESHAPDSRRD